MQREIKCKNKVIAYSVRESTRARCLRITIHQGGELSATLPRGFRLEQLEKFIQQKADWILQKIDLARKRKPSIFFPKSSRREYLKLKEKTRELAIGKVKEHNMYYNFSYCRISIRNQKTRWGSCSRKGNLSFNYKIIHLPEKHLDYIIVHELCHLKELNHSSRFWDLVALSIPDYKKIRKELLSA
jgi:predicted metal-dependent hydrolase